MAETAELERQRAIVARLERAVEARRAVALASNISDRALTRLYPDRPPPEAAADADVRTRISLFGGACALALSDVLIYEYAEHALARAREKLARLECDGPAPGADYFNPPCSGGCSSRICAIRFNKEIEADLEAHVREIAAIESGDTA
jgi:hypothetical protein